MRRVVTLCVIVLWGCSSSQTVTGGPATQETIRVERPGGATEVRAVTMPTAGVSTVQAPLDQVWRLLPSAYSALGIPIAQLDSASHTVGNPGIRVRRHLGNTPLSRYLDCGRAQGGPSADTYEVHLSVLTQARPDTAGGTMVATTVQAMARPVTFSGGYTRCSTTGALEQRIVSLLEESLRE